MGCPAKRVVAGECGSALMKEPELAQELVRAVRAAVPADMPVTVKHRAGWDERHLNAPEFACAMVEAGAAMITVHGRTRTQGFTGKSGSRHHRQGARRGAVAHAGRRQRRRRHRRRLLPHARGDRLRRRHDRPRRARQPVAVPRHPGAPRAASAITEPTVADRMRMFCRHVDLIAAHTPPKASGARAAQSGCLVHEGLARLRARARARVQRDGSDASARDRDCVLLVAGSRKKRAARDRFCSLTSLGDKSRNTPRSWLSCCANSCSAPPLPWSSSASA